MDRSVTVELEGEATWSRHRSLGMYGAAPDKRASRTEGRVPYAWVFYLELRAARGSAYAPFDGTMTGLVHAENLALARSEAARWRAADKVRFSALPSTSDETLEGWADRLGVERYPSDTRHELRLRCAAKYRLSAGDSRRQIDEAVAELLGPVFVRCWRQEGPGLATPPPITYWPGVNPGPAGYSLGGGAWLSERSHLVVEVQRPPSMTIADFLQLVNVQLFRLLDRVLPQWCTFDWAMGISDGGFLLDISQMDFVGMTP